MSNELVVSKPAMSLADVMQIGQVMSQSGFFSDSKSAAQAVVKILAGQELGFGPFASMTGIHIIQGKPAVGANLMAAAVKGNGRYDYRVAEMTDTACEIIFFERGQEVGRSRFTADDARRAGTQNLSKFPRNMLFARAISNGVKWYCPNAFGGAPVYTPEELGATVNEDGDIIPGEIIEHTPEPPAPEPVKAQPKPAQPKPQPAATSGNGGKDWRKETLAAKTLNEFCNRAAFLLTDYNGEQHIKNALEGQPGFVYDRDNNAELLKWLEERKQPTAATQAAAFDAMPSASGAFAEDD